MASVHAAVAYRHSRDIRLGARLASNGPVLELHGGRARRKGMGHRAPQVPPACALLTGTMRNPITRLLVDVGESTDSSGAGARSAWTAPPRLVSSRFFHRRLDDMPMRTGSAIGGSGHDAQDDEDETDDTPDSAGRIRMDSLGEIDGQTFPVFFGAKVPLPTVSIPYYTKLAANRDRRGLQTDDAAVEEKSATARAVRPRAPLGRPRRWRRNKEGGVVGRWGKSERGRDGATSRGG